MRIASLLAGLALLASVPASAGELGALRDMDARIAAIAQKLAVSSAPICPRTAPLAGMLVQDIGQYAPAYRDAARAELGLSDVPTVTVVVPGSAAARAGVMPGDRIIAINGRATVRSAAGEASYAVAEATLGALDDAMATPPANLSLERKGLAVPVVLSGDHACPAKVELVPGKRLAATADGRTVHVSTALAGFAGSDDAVAIVVAHEMAHNILRHAEKLDAQGIKRGVLAPFGKNRSAIRATEIEADRFAFYMLARAGYDLDDGLDFLKRFGAKTDLGPLNDGTHPGKKERVERALRTIAEVRALKAAGRDIVPPPLTLVE